MAMIEDDWAAFKIENFVDVSNLVEEPNYEFKHISYNRKGIPTEKKVESNSVVNGNTFSRYNYPKYKYTAYQIRNALEDILKEKLLVTYHYDRFYYINSLMSAHKDRPACEVSVSLNISSNLMYEYPLVIITDEEEVAITTNPGDAIVYQGTKYSHKRGMLLGDSKTYYHQAFFHYVRADGYHVEEAWDSGKNLP